MKAKMMSFKGQVSWAKNDKTQIYNNKYSSIIDIYFYETFSTQTSSAFTPSHPLDTLSDILDKCLCFFLIKIESVSFNPSQAMLASLLLSVVYTFLLKMLLLVLIKNCNSFVCLIWILSNKLDLNKETPFTIHRKGVGVGIGKQFGVKN